MIENGMRNPRPRLAALLCAAWVALLCGATAFGQVTAKYQYSLSNFGGRLPYDWVRLHVDPVHNETYVIDANRVQVFGPTGMEVFEFGEDLDLGPLIDLAVDGNGEILILSYKDEKTILTRCNYRGVPLGPVAITGLPEGLVFAPNRMVLRDGTLYFISPMAMQVILTDVSGRFKRHISLLPLVDVEGKQKSGAEMTGFAVDRDGSIYFSVAVLFQVFKLTSGGEISSFGKPGSVAGRFGVIGGVAVDTRGNVFVADRLKCVVMAFDKDFKFLAEFGYRGPKQQNLIIPDDLGIDGRDRLYVSQAGKRGVSVFALLYAE